MKEKIFTDCDVIHQEIVDEVIPQMPLREQIVELAELYKMLSEPTRLKIMWALKGHEMCVCDLAVLLNMTKSAVSHQLKLLRMSNLIDHRKEGKVVFYFLADQYLVSFLEAGLEHIMRQI